MQNNKFWLIIVSLGFSLLFVCAANSQSQSPAYNGGTYVNQMIRDRMMRRRMAQRQAARKGKTAPPRKTTLKTRPSDSTQTEAKTEAGQAVTDTKTNNKLAKEYSESGYPYIRVGQYLYRTIPIQDSYTVTFFFKPVGKDNSVITKTHTYNFANGLAEFNGIPEGKYEVTAETVYKGIKYPAYIGNVLGDNEDPKGTIGRAIYPIEIKSELNTYNKMGLVCYPFNLFVRVMN